MCLRLYTSAGALMLDSVVGLRCMFSVCLCVSTDALFGDGVGGVSQQDIGETGLQQVHSQEGRLLHNLKHKRQQRQTVRQQKYLTPNATMLVPSSFSLGCFQPWLNLSGSIKMNSGIRFSLCGSCQSNPGADHLTWMKPPEKEVQLQFHLAEYCCTRCLFFVVYVAICNYCTDHVGYHPNCSINIFASV